MNTITIRNIGPIIDVTLELNKVNVIIGPQSSGKSTIAKIISYCTWVEKDVATSQSLEEFQNNENYFRERLESFHKIKGYFKPNSYISYSSEVVNIKYESSTFSISWVDKYAYKRSKISYIPSERNMVSLSEIDKLELSNTNIRSFLFDWFTARKRYTQEQKLSILNLGVDYYHVEGVIKEDHIKGINNAQEYDILLPFASSGLQSITPLIATIDFLTHWIYNQEEDISFEANEKRTKANQSLVRELVLKPYFNEDNFDEVVYKDKVTKINEQLKLSDENAKKYVNKYREIRENLVHTNNIELIIEEPEQNLFPETQRDIIYYLLERCLGEKDHRLTITTHSPYVLYAINNCMMGGLVYEKMSDSDKARLKCVKSIINPEKVSAYEIRNGKLKQIQQNDKLIGANYLDQKMKELMDDFYVLLNYYGR